MDVTKSLEQNLWTTNIILFTILMSVLFLITFYFGYLFNLLWCVGLGLFYGIVLSISYYYDTRKKRSFSLMYVIQAAVVFAIILIFVHLQSIYGPNPLAYDFLILAFSMLFAGGMFGIPAYRYAKIKPKPTQEQKTQAISPSV